LQGIPADSGTRVEPVPEPDNIDEEIDELAAARELVDREEQRPSP
jgi:hypothetical protein